METQPRGSIFLVEEDMRRTELVMDSYTCMREKGRIEEEGILVEEAVSGSTYFWKGSDVSGYWLLSLTRLHELNDSYPTRQEFRKIERARRGFFGIPYKSWLKRLLGQDPAQHYPFLRESLTRSARRLPFRLNAPPGVQVTAAIALALSIGLTLALHAVNQNIANMEQQNRRQYSQSFPRPSYENGSENRDGSAEPSTILFTLEQRYLLWGTTLSDECQTSGFPYFPGSKRVVDENTPNIACQDFAVEFNKGRTTSYGRPVVADRDTIQAYETIRIPVRTAPAYE